MRRNGFFAALAAVAMMAGPAMAVSSAGQDIMKDVAPRPARAERRNRHCQRLSDSGCYRSIRSRAKAARPKRRANRLHVSKRTRRRHRRAA